MVKKTDCTAFFIYRPVSSGCYPLIFHVRLAGEHARLPQREKAQQFFHFLFSAVLYEASGSSYPEKEEARSLPQESIRRPAPMSMPTLYGTFQALTIYTSECGARLIVSRATSSSIRRPE